MTLDRSAFVTSIAHRGLHDGKGLLENTAPAFEAGLDGGFGLECDLQPAADGTPFVFHDFTLDRLVGATGRVAARSASELAAIKYRDRDLNILTLGEFLDLAAGRGPLLVEIKSDFSTPDERFLKKIADLAAGYKGPLALMSFDPGVMVRMAELAPSVPRGIVSGVYAGPDWHIERIGTERAARLTDLLESGPARVSFFAYHVKALPRAVPRYARDVQGLPLFTWTVRTAEDRKVAREWADAAIFEGNAP